MSNTGLNYNRWTCQVCGDTRKIEEISAVRKPVFLDGKQLEICSLVVRSCNDREECLSKANRLHLHN